MKRGRYHRWAARGRPGETVACLRCGTRGLVLSSGRVRAVEAADLFGTLRPCLAARH